MKPIFVLGALLLGVTVDVASAQNAPLKDTPVPLPAPQDVVQGEVYFVERIALPPGAKLFVSLAGRVAGADDLPLAASIFAARNGITPFRLLVPQGLAPAGPYRIQAWIVADNRVQMVGASPTILRSLNDKPLIRVRIQRALQPIDAPAAIAPTQLTTAPYFVRGTVEKRDRRTLAPDAQIEVTLSDVSLADAPSRVLGRQTFSIRGKQLPVPFAVPIQLAQLQERRRYSLSVRITENGRLLYVSDTSVPVTQENVRTAFQISVVPANGG